MLQHRVYQSLCSIVVTALLRQTAALTFLLAAGAASGQNLTDSIHLPGAAKASVEISGNIALVEGVSERVENDLIREETIYFNFYEQTGDGSWSVQDTLVEVVEGYSTHFGGGKISLDKDVAAFGYMNRDRSSDQENPYPNQTFINGGEVLVYERNEINQWVKTATLNQTENWERFGRAVSVSNNTIAVLSAPFYQAKSSIYLFEKDGSGHWHQTGTLNDIANPYLTRFFDIDYQEVGDACCGLNATLFDVDNDRIIALESNEDGFLTLNAVVFERGGDGEWKREAQLPADDWSSVDLHGNSAVISENGKVTFYDIVENNRWEINNSFSQLSNAFGWDVALDDNYAVVLSKEITYTYQRDENGVWFEKQLIYGNTSGSVAISGSRVVVGSGSVERHGGFVVDLESASINLEACIDTGIIGDGWGWNGQSSCFTNSASDECDYEDAQYNNGWGWNPARQESCEPKLSNCIDSDGDGWGWDGIATCLP